MHTWHIGGSLKNCVEHSSRDDCTGSDSGGGMEAVLGPFASTAAALEVAMALNHGYGTGRLDGRTALLEQQSGTAPPATREDIREMLRTAWQRLNDTDEAEADAFDVLQDLMSDLALAFSIDTSTYEKGSAPDPYDPTSDDGTVAHDGLDMPSYGS